VSYDQNAPANPVRFGRRGIDPAQQTPSLAAASADSFGQRELRTSSQAISDDGNAPGGNSVTRTVETARAREWDLAAFFGPNADCYLGTYYASEEGGRSGAPHVLERASSFNRSFLWVAFFFPLPWLFYRRFYALGSAFLIGSIVLTLLAPKVGAAAAGLGANIFFLIAGKRLYLNRAIRAIQKADERALRGPERRAYLERLGGASVPALIAAILLLAACSAVPFIAGFKKGLEAVRAGALPSCSSSKATDVAAKILAGATFAPSASPSVWRFSDISDRTPAGGAEQHECHATASAGQITAIVSYTVTWKDDERKLFAVHLSAERVFQN
jgi:hypothetical protein